MGPSFYIGPFRGMTMSMPLKAILNTKYLFSTTPSIAVVPLEILGLHLRIEMSDLSVNDLFSDEQESQYLHKTKTWKFESFSNLPFEAFVIDQEFVVVGS